MSVKGFAGLAIMLGLVLFAAAISGCADQGEVKQPAPTPEEKETLPEKSGTVEKEASVTETGTADFAETIRTYDAEVREAEKALSDMGYELSGEETNLWDRKVDELVNSASDADQELRESLLREAVSLKYYEVQNLRSLVAVARIEKTYWDMAVDGKNISSFYSPDGRFFYGSGKSIENISASQMVKKMNAIRSLEFQSLEIYHFGTGSTLKVIREGGRTVGAGQISDAVSITVGAKNGVRLNFSSESLPALRLVDPQSGETVMKVAPDMNGNYVIPPVNTTLLGVVDDVDLDKLKELCKPLPPDTVVLQPMPEEPDELVICPSPQIAPFVFEPTDDGIYPTPIDSIYLMPGEYKITALTMNADLKELAEQLVNINVRVGGDAVSTNSPKKALDAFQSAIAKSISAEFKTPREAGLPGSQELPAPDGVQVIQEDSSLSVKVYVISDTHGNVLIAIGDPGVKQGTKKPSSSRVASDYLDRVFLEVFTARNSTTGEEVKVVSFKILGIDGKFDYRTTETARAKDIRMTVLPLENTTGKS
ncbi:hypothetical protein [Geoglobus sp.]